MDFLSGNFNNIIDLFSKSMIHSENSKKPVLISYPNSGEEYDADTKEWNGSSDLPDDMTNYTKVTQSWVNETSIGAIGGCCRTCPNHIRALSLHYKK